jgi:gas vesicle protein
MKKNKGLIIGLAAAGVAIAGAVIFFAATKTGRDTMKKWGPMGKKLADGAEDLVKTAKKKFENLKEELVPKDGELVSQGYE